MGMQDAGINLGRKTEIVTVDDEPFAGMGHAQRGAERLKKKPVRQKLRESRPQVGLRLGTAPREHTLALSFRAPLGKLHPLLALRLDKLLHAETRQREIDYPAAIGD